MAKEEAKEKKEEAHEEAPKPKSKKKLFIIIGVVVLLAGGAGAFAMMGGKKAAPAEGEEAEVHEEQKHLIPIKLDTFIVNLSENASFLKIRMTLEYDPEILARATGGGEGGGHGGGGAGGEGAAPGGLPPGLIEKESQIRDAIIATLSSKAAADVLTTEGKEQLKEDLIESINEAIGFEEGPIVNVYFNEFLIQ